MIKPAKSVGVKGNGNIVAVESVADILERELKHVIEKWLMRVEKSRT